MDWQGPLERARGAERGLERVLHETREQLAARVCEARNAGATWQQIGEIVGMSPQGCQQRWGRDQEVA